MARAIYPHELSDPDFSWLINSFRESNPGYILVDTGSLPMVMIKEYDSHSEFRLTPPSQIGTPEERELSKAK